VTDEIAPGVRRMRPDDHFMVLSENDTSPMHVGALVFLEVPEAERGGLLGRLRDHFAARLPATPLLARLVQAPDGYDSDVWADVAAADPDAHFVRESAPTPDAASLNAAVARLNMARLDLARPPFKLHLFDALPGDCAAFYFKMHHCVADGIGFQEVLRLLSDDCPSVPARTSDAVLPSREAWLAQAEARFAAEEPLRAADSARRKAALAAIEAIKGERARTPVLGLSGPTSPARSYVPMSIALAPFKAAAKALGATVNDLFLACAAQAMRSYLLEIGDLPDQPLVVNSARSYRRPEHGPYGNRIVALHPHLATHIADPMERLRAIQASMAAELRRSPLDEAMLGALERPYGARDRRETFARRSDGGGRLLPGNLSLSNVPGPAGKRSFAGYRQRHNFPVPIIGSGRFFNITSRRSGDNLDMGVMADAEKIPDAARPAVLFREALTQYAAFASAQN